MKRYLAFGWPGADGTIPSGSVAAACPFEYAKYVRKYTNDGYEFIGQYPSDLAAEEAIHCWLRDSAYGSLKMPYVRLEAAG